MRLPRFRIRTLVVAVVCGGLAAATQRETLGRQPALQVAWNVAIFTGVFFAFAMQFVIAWDLRGEGKNEGLRPPLPVSPEPPCARSAMRLPRMTTRRWMLVVAIVALAAALIHRQAEFQARAAMHRTHELGARGALRRMRGTPYMVEMLRFLKASAEERTRMPARREARDKQLRELERYHAASADKYERAARYPWLPVPPDPPAPE